ncbi:DUF2922 domain-containing protein [Pseudogracilibacillus sp. ICA-222130]|uniref:DUF2922 domain-containing protein n=1 Tax=Pseudogracilibacillus sp. ICA-222130 TaxID=3134655 RepID=UPI0030BAA550
MKRLELQFVDAGGKTVTYTLDNPVDPQDAEQVAAVMDEMIAQDAFASKDGPIVAKKGARIVERTVTDIDIGLE